MEHPPYVPLVFLHIPKAAGSTLQAVLRRVYRARPTVYFNGRPDEVEIFASLPEAQRHAVDIVAGHVHYGVHRHMREGARYLTMLRDPVDRVVSHYHYVLRETNHVEHPRVVSEGLSLDDYVRTSYSRMIDNDHVRWLNEALHQDVDFGCVSRGMLDEAKRVLVEDVAALGLVERFDESLELARRALHWADTSYTRLNVTEGRPAPREGGERTEQRIRELNTLDIELYEFAVSLFDEMLREHGVRDEARFPASASPRAFDPVSNRVGGAAESLRVGETMSNDPPLPVLYLHLPKAAGSTLRKILLDAYKGRKRHYLSDTPDELAAFLAMPEADRHAIDFLFGHQHYGLYEHLRQPVTQITMLRDPVERCLSLYYYVHREPNHRLHEQLRDSDMSVEDCYAQRISREFDNGQTRWLSGIKHFQVPFGSVTRDMLETAKSRLEHSFAVVGLAERFDESVVLMKRRLGWAEVPRYRSLNVTSARPGAADIPEETAELIRAHNLLDIELYDFARELFERALAEEGPRLAEEAERVRRANAAEEVKA